MITRDGPLAASRLFSSTAVIATACLTFYALVRSASGKKLLSKTLASTRASTNPYERQHLAETLPYPPDAFPGARLVYTPYGTIKVFEWGPETGEKVLLIHGIGTPCIALGNMAHELVRNGFRVMLFGESQLGRYVSPPLPLTLAGLGSCLAEQLGKFVDLFAPQAESPGWHLCPM
jgi:hypothetical protein